MSIQIVRRHQMESDQYCTVVTIDRVYQYMTDGADHRAKAIRLLHKALAKVDAIIEAEKEAERARQEARCFNLVRKFMLRGVK